MAIIQVSNVTKEFRLGRSRSFRSTVADALLRMTGRAIHEPTPFAALKNLTFSVHPGEVIGVIGHNGAGKSTLLKLLAGISTPTHGSIDVRGRVAPLIEVGAGLVGELTGRENIFLNGAILGMRRTDIKAKLDDIVAFAELEDFIDTPVKRYSSGMTVRLGFAIATSAVAEILIVDEVLAVGDLAFQRKCFDRMEEIIKREGRTVLLVSHNIRQVERMCQRVLMLDHGEVIADGPAGPVCDHFFKSSNEAIRRNIANTSSGRIQTSGEAELLEIQVLDSAGRPVHEIASGGSLRVRVAFRLNRPLLQPELIVGTHTTDFLYLTGSSTAVYDDRPDLGVGRHEVEVVLPSYPLAPGIYSVRFVILDRSRRVVLAGDNLRTFAVGSAANEAREEGFRILNLPVRWVLNGKGFSLGQSDQRAALESKSPSIGVV